MGSLCKYLEVDLIGWKVLDPLVLASGHSSACVANSQILLRQSVTLSLV